MELNFKAALIFAFFAFFFSLLAAKEIGFYLKATCHSYMECWSLIMMTLMLQFCGIYIDFCGK